MLLITTKIESNINNKSLLLLGSWCKDYTISNPEHHGRPSIIPHRWEEFDVLEQDYYYISELYERILSSISGELNTLHDIKRSTRYWRILLGPWLDSYITVFFDRWFAIKYAIDNYDINKVTVSEQNDTTFIPSNYHDYINKVFEDDWNLQLCSIIVKYLVHNTEIGLSMVKLNKFKSNDIKNNTAANVLSRKFMQIAYDIARNIISPFLSDDRYLILSSNLSLVNEFKLNLKLGQLPYKYANSFRINQPLINRNLRNGLNLRTFSPLSFFERALSECLPMAMPTAYLEGFSAMMLELKSLNYPKKPKAIFSTNALTDNEIIKLYIAEASEKRTRLILGQHGGYGVPKFMRAEDHEKACSDRFLTWGWIDNSDKTYPVGFIKAKKVVKKACGPIPSSLLMIRGLWGRYKFRIDSGSGHNQDHSIESCIALANQLPKLLRTNLLVRLYFNDYGFEEEARWKRDCPKANIKHGDENLQNLIDKARLIVYTYNVGTGWMEYMAADIPVILFWDAKTSPVRNQAKAIFDEFELVGIFHETPYSASSHIVKIWDDIYRWWNSLEVINAKRRFLDTYCNLNYDVVDQIKINILDSSCGV